MSIQPQVSTEHRNLYTTYGNEQANHLIKKIEISNIRRKYPRINEKIYDLDNFDDQLELFDQFRAYISNTASIKNALDFLLNKECQQAAQRHEFFTNQKLEWIYIDMRNTLGFMKQKDPTKRDDSAINVKITLRSEAARNLEVIILGQGYGEFLYERRNKGTIMSMYKYKVTSEEAKRKRFGAYRDIDLESTNKKIAK